MNFENPIWLYWTPLIVLAVAGLIVFGRRRRDTLLQKFAAARLLKQLTEKADLRRILVKGVLIVLACCLIGIALARPQYGVDFVERKARGLDIVFVLDSSKSMLATDLRPTRLERAKLAIMDLVNQLESDRIGLVVFAGDAFLQTPPTLDYSAFRENLNSVAPNSISRGGSNIGQALREAAKAFPKDNNFKIVILMTDGEDLEERAIAAAREIAKDNIKVYSIGIGTPEGTYLKVRSKDGNEEFIRDSSGQPVRSCLDETTLQKISQLTGGNYSRLAGQSLERLYNSVLATLPREERESELQETRIERYQWVLFIAVMCLIAETLIRRRKNISVQMLVAFTLISLITTTPLKAEENSVDETIREIAPEERSDDARVIYNQAHSSLIDGDYAAAIDLYKTAIEYSDDITLEQNSLYNMAHANNQLGEQALQAKDYEAAIDYWKQAEALFKSANELNSNDQESLEDAKLMKNRRKTLEDFLEQQQKQSSEQEQSSGQEQSDDNNSNSEPSASENESDEKSGKNQADSDTSTEGMESETNGDSNTESESTGEPTEDIQEQNDTNASEQSSENDAETGKKDEALPQKSDKNNTAGGTQKAVTVPEGMDIIEAQRLLDSLQNNERLLPFTGPSDKQGKKGETRDW